MTSKADLKRMMIRLVTSLLCVSFWACGTESQTSGPGFRNVDAFPLERLSQYDFFEGAMSKLTPTSGVVPYQVTSPLWADHAGKARFIVLPEGETITPNGDEDWDFPEGTILIKNFFYSTDRREPEATATPIETRLMIKGTNDWKGHTYVWNDDLTEANRKASGTRRQLSFINVDGEQASQEYIVPNTNQCKDCHERHDYSRPLGLVQRQLSRSVYRDGQDQNQLDYLNALGLFNPKLTAPTAGHLVDPFGPASLETRARSYLDANCALPPRRR